MLKQARTERYVSAAFCRCERKRSSGSERLRGLWVIRSVRNNACELAGGMRRKQCGPHGRLRCCKPCAASPFASLPGRKVAQSKAQSIQANGKGRGLGWIQVVPRLSCQTTMSSVDLHKTIWRGPARASSQNVLAYIMLHWSSQTQASGKLEQRVSVLRELDEPSDISPLAQLCDHVSMTALCLA